MMRTTLTAIALLSIVCAGSTAALAQSNTTVGVGAGAVTGAVVAGPVGAVVGAIAGGFIGASTEPRRRYVRYYHRKKFANRRYHSAR